jgi:hypothetical protein
MAAAQNTAAEAAIPAYETLTVPAHALHFPAVVSLAALSAKEGKDGTPASGVPDPRPFKLVLRTSEPVNHPYWGPFVHDFAGMIQHKDTYPLDYCHDSGELIGHFSGLDASSGDLTADGLIDPFQPDDRASEILHRADTGTPYEASLLFNKDTARIERLDENEMAMVNGRQVNGPMTIFRNWEIRGGALCPYGADKYAHAELAEDAASACTIQRIRRPAMGVNDGKTPAAADAAAKAGELAATTAAVDAQSKAVVGLTRAEEGKRFTDAFGDPGAMYFAQGLSFEAAQTAELKRLQAENGDMKKRLGGAQLAGAAAAAEGLSFGEKTPLSSETADADPAKTTMTALQQRFGKNIGAFMAAIVLPGKAGAK